MEDDYQSIDGHLLFQCPKCFLLFKAPESWPSLNIEKEIYDLHQNEISDNRYLNYLLKTLQPIVERISGDSYGLDYGCGPSKGIEALCGERGIKCLSYDPIFFPNEDIFSEAFHFIVLNEVAEHFQKPGDEFEKIISLLEEDGLLALRTEAPPNDLKGWWYMKDPTHIVFYKQETLHYLELKFSLKIIYQYGPITIFEKK